MTIALILLKPRSGPYYHLCCWALPSPITRGRRAHLRLPIVVPSSLAYHLIASPNADPQDPTHEKPESKLWYERMTWFATLWSGAAQSFAIHHLPSFPGIQDAWSVSMCMPSNTPCLLNDPLDPYDYKTRTSFDTLWDGNVAQPFPEDRLYIASHVHDTGSAPSPCAGTACELRLFRFIPETSGDRYTLEFMKPIRTDPAPSTVSNLQLEALTIAMASNGDLWATWTANNHVMVTRTIGHCAQRPLPAASECDWLNPVVLPGSGLVRNDDISAVVTVGDSIGVMWSNQSHGVCVGGGPDDGKSCDCADAGATCPAIPGQDVCSGGANAGHPCTATRICGAPAVCTPTGISPSLPLGTSQAMLFSTHPDSVSQIDQGWTTVEVAYGGKGTLGGDDHINLKSLPDGRVFAATKTSKADKIPQNTADPNILLLVRSGNPAAWTPFEFGTGAQDHSRPIVLLDEYSACVYMFATHTDNEIVAKVKGMNDSTALTGGTGAPTYGAIVLDPSERLNNVTSTKQNILGDLDLIVLASARKESVVVGTHGHYFHRRQCINACGCN